MVEINKEINRMCVYGENLIDVDIPEAIWNIYALPDNEEIVVELKYNGNSYSIHKKSIIVIPPMIDRKFGIDRRDYEIVNLMRLEIGKYMINNKLITPPKRNPEIALLLHEKNKGKIEIMDYFFFKKEN